jgi:hypothetical protein
MNSSMTNPVDRISTTAGLSTENVILEKLFIVGSIIKSHLQTVFAGSQVLDVKVEKRLVHRNRACLSTTAIDL